MSDLARRLAAGLGSAELPSTGGPMPVQFDQNAAAEQANPNRDPFSPGAPLAPWTPFGSPPIGWAPPVSYNKVYSPDKRIGVRHDILRRFADSTVIVNVVRDAAKRQLRALKWDIVVKDPKKSEHPRLEELREYFRRPDREMLFSDWLSALLEDLFVIGAPCLGKLYDGNGKPAGLRVMNSAEIVPILTSFGTLQKRPSFAYYGVHYGIPYRGYHDDEIVYRPFNRRSWTPFGFCYDSETEILTSNGWKYFSDLDGTEDVATRSPEGAFEWQRPTAYTNVPYAGPMMRFRSQVFDLLVTPQHRMLVRDRHKADREFSGAEEIRDAQWFADSPGRCYNYIIPSTSRWEGKEPTSFGLSDAEPQPGRHHRALAVDIPIDAWVGMLGLFLSEGSVLTNSAAPNANAIEIDQSEGSQHLSKMAQILQDTGLPWSYHTRSPQDGRVGNSTSGRFILNHGPLAAYFRENCYDGSGHRAWNKAIPQEVKDYSPRLLTLLVDAMMMGDGHVEYTGFRRYSTTSKKLADDLVEVLQKAGREGWNDVILPSEGTLGRRPVYRVAERQLVEHRVPVPTSIEYDGTIHCVTVPNGIVYVRRNGRTAWCGNSPVEQLLGWLLISLNRQNYYANWYAETSVPPQWVIGPENFTEKQLSFWQTYLDQIMSGQGGQIHKARMLPGGFMPKEGRKELEFDYEFDESIIRLTCESFGVSPSFIAKTSSLGKGTQGVDQSAQDAGLACYAAFIEEMIQGYIDNDLNCPELEFRFLEEESNAKGKSETEVNDLKVGLRTLNETRTLRGDDPYDSKLYPEADMPLIYTATGVVPVHQEEPEPPPPIQVGPDGLPVMPNREPVKPGVATKKPEDVGEDDLTKPTDAKAIAPIPPTAQNEGSQPWKLELLDSPDDDFVVWLVDGDYVEATFDPDFTQGSNGYAHPGFVPINEIWIDDRQPEYDREIVLNEHELPEVYRMRDFGDDYDTAHAFANGNEQSVRRANIESGKVMGTVEVDSGEGAPARQSESPVNPGTPPHGACRIDLRKWERMAKARVKAGKPVRQFVSESIPPARQAWINTQLPDVTKAFRHPVRTDVKTWRDSHRARTAGDAIKAWALMKLPHWYEHYKKQAVQAFKADDDWSDPDVSDRDVFELSAVLEGGFTAGVEDSAELLGGGKVAATEYARTRAGQLLGKTWDDEAGEWIDQAEESKWYLPGTVRDKIRGALADAVESGAGRKDLESTINEMLTSDIPYRAQLIERTELRSSYNTGAVANYRSVGVERVELSDGSGLNDGCDQRDGNIVSLEEFLQLDDDEHPNGTLAGIPVLDEEGE